MQYDTAFPNLKCVHEPSFVEKSTAFKAKTTEAKDLKTVAICL